MLTTLGKRLRAARQAKGYGQRKLAELAGVHEKTVSRWENDRQPPKAAELERVAHELDTTVEWLLRGDVHKREVYVSRGPGFELEDYVRDLNRIVRTLRNMPGGDVGQRMKAGFLTLVEEAARESGAHLTPEYWELRRRVHEGEL